MAGKKGRHRHPDEILGKKFGKLTAISYRSEYSGHVRHKIKKRWTCRCDCGTVVERWQCSLFARATPACENCTKETHGFGPENARFAGYGELSLSYYNGVKSRAPKSGWEFTVSIEYLWKLFLAQNRKCALSGLPLRFSGRRAVLKYGEQTASLDRIDSTKGYIEGNVQWLHKDVNLMKNHFMQDHFVATCILIAARQKKDDPAGEYTI